MYVLCSYCTASKIECIYIKHMHAVPTLYTALTYHKYLHSLTKNKMYAQKSTHGVSPGLNGSIIRRNTCIMWRMLFPVLFLGLVCRNGLWCGSKKEQNGREEKV